MMLIQTKQLSPTLCGKRYMGSECALFVHGNVLYIGYT